MESIGTSNLGPSSLNRLTEKRIFTLAEAQDLLPVVSRVTGRAQKEIQRLSALLNRTDEAILPEHNLVQQKIETIFGQWQDHIRRLGAEPKGFWNVDFDNGRGYFCWKYPEPEIIYWHGYQDGFTGRVKVSSMSPSSRGASVHPQVESSMR